MPSISLACVATITAAEGGAELEALIGALCAQLPQAGSPRWLDPGRACDVPFTATAADLTRLRGSVSAWQFETHLAFDVILQPMEGRRKRLFLADMDSTIIGQECIDELADFAGLKPMVSAITERAMRGELAFEPALRERVALLEGLPVAVVDAVLRDRITLTPGATTLVRTMRANGTYCALVSGGFTLFTGPVAQQIGFDEHRGNLLGVAGERFSGFVADPILGREAKLAALVELRHRLGLTPTETLAVGDGANDLAMIGEAGLGVAFRAKPAVAAAAAARIDHTDLTTLLFAQGYARADFVEL